MSEMDPPWSPTIKPTPLERWCEFCRSFVGNETKTVTVREKSHYADGMCTFKQQGCRDCVEQLRSIIWGDSELTGMGWRT